ncbi:MAG TPA: hypothetical protein VIK02_02930 [Candidatus Anoxymicrobiaceae bacterium]
MAINKSGRKEMEQVSDVLKVAANAYTLLMENEKVRVWLEAGSHAAENIGNTDGYDLVVEI